MAIDIPGSGADDVASDQLAILLDPLQANIVPPAPQPFARFASYAATGTEATTAFLVYCFKIPPNTWVRDLVFEHGNFVDGGGAFNCNVGTENDVDCFVVDEAMGAAGSAQKGDGSAAGRSPQATEEWLTVQFEAPGASMAVGAQFRVHATLVSIQ